MKTEAFDQYLAQCVRHFLQSQAMPVWPAGLDVDATEAMTRVTFHGVALLLVESKSSMSGWPDQLVDAVREEARLQSFWELSHKQAIGTLVDALHQAGIETLILKGSALAYSVYPHPALRRRGDSDILIETAERDKVRKVFRACGFNQWSDVRPLQECWQSPHQLGFDHTIDLHWRLSASPAVSALLEANSYQRRSVPLPDLSTHARGIGAVDNLLLVCINRAAHGRFGYQVGDAILMENDRLIWALDIHLLASALSGDDWAQLVKASRASGSCDIVLSGLALARTSLETKIPKDVLDELEEHSADARLTHYLAHASGRARFRLDLAATSTFKEKARLVALKIYPTREQLLERYPSAGSWPTIALRIRRVVSGFVNLVKGRA